MGVTQLHQGQAAGAGLKALQVHGVLYGDGVDLAEQAVGNAQQLQLQGSAFGGLAVKPQLADVMGLAGGNVGKNRDNALGSQREQGNDLVIVAGVDGQVVAAEGADLGHLADVAAGLFDAHDVGVLCQRRHGGGGDVAPGAGGDVVQDAGHTAGVRNIGKELNQTVLGGLIIIGGHQQHGVGAHLARVFGQVDGIGGIVAAGTRDDRNATRHPLYTVANDLFMLVVRQGGGLAGGARHHDGVDALGDLPVDEAAELLVVHAGGGHGGDDGGSSAGKDGVLHNSISFLYTKKRIAA